MLTPKEREYCYRCNCSKCNRGCLTCFKCVLNNKNIFMCEGK